MARASESWTCDRIAMKFFESLLQIVSASRPQKKCRLPFNLRSFIIPSKRFIILFLTAAIPISGSAYAFAEFKLGSPKINKWPIASGVEPKSSDITTESFSFRHFTIPSGDLPPRPHSPDLSTQRKHSNEIAALLKPRPKEAEQLLQKWFVGKELSEFIRFFEDLKIDQVAANEQWAKFVWDNFGELDRHQQTDLQTDKARKVIRRMMANQQRDSTYVRISSSNFRFFFNHFPPVERLQILKDYVGGPLSMPTSMSKFRWYLDVDVVDKNVVGISVNVISH